MAAEIEHKVDFEIVEFEIKGKSVRSQARGAQRDPGS